MKKLAIIAIGAAAALAAFGVSDLAAQGSVTAQGKVQGAAVWNNSTAQALEFGEMTPTGGTATRTVGLLETDLDPVNGNAGTIDVRLNKSNTNISFTLPAELDGAAGTNTLAVSGYECGLAVGSNATTAPSPANTGELNAYAASCLSGTTELDVGALTGARLVRVYLGGEILGSDIDNALADDYSGTITVTALIP